MNSNPEDPKIDAPELSGSALAALRQVYQLAKAGAPGFSTESIPPELLAQFESEQVDRGYLGRIIGEVEAELSLFEKGDNVFSRQLDERDPGLRPKVIALIRQELEVFSSLSLNTPKDRIDAIRQSYSAQKEALYTENSGRRA